MPSFRRDFLPAPFPPGFSRAELLALIGLLVMLALVAMGPLSHYLEKAKINRAVEKARTINTLLSQYATDNNGVYPVGLDTPVAGKSEGIARNLLENNYTPDATVFALDSAAKYGGTAADFSDLSAANISWDFTAGATIFTGLTSASPDLLPTVYSTGENVTYPTQPGAGLNLALTGAGPFGRQGLVVAYKGNNAVFLRATLNGNKAECDGFISTALKDTSIYTQIKP